MRVLAFDTATPATAVALVDDAADREPQLCLEARDDPPAGARPNHTRTLLSLIEDVLQRGGGGWEQVDRIAVGVGPGTFTGLRIGLATAHALARAREIDLVGVSTLAALALAAHRERPHAPVLAVLDARRGEAFAAAWAAGASPRRDPACLEPCVLTPEQLEMTVRRLGDGAGGGLAVGDGAVKFRATLERAGLDVPPEDLALHRISAREHCSLAVDLRPGAPDDVHPSYLRLPDAELSLTRRE